MRVNTRGVTRTVILTRRWAFKLPGTWHRGPRYWWKHLLLGLLANLQEVEFAATGWPELCPIRFSLPGGWLVVMPRLRTLSEAEYEAAAPAEAMYSADYEVPVEYKPDSFGWYRGRLVAVDYGGGGYGGRARRPYLKGDD